jgi:transcriptional regulator with XRE-family HTH domain
MELAETLIRLRKDKGWTQAIAAKNIAIQQSYLSKLENGHYQPSSDVIDKLCLAYGVQVDALIDQPKAQHTLTRYLLSSTVIAATIGLLLLINGYFSLVFPQTYYTYKTQVISAVGPSAVTLNYHLTDYYQGDKYIESFSGVKYEYTLLSTREVSRVENRWLMSLGTLLLLSSLIIFLLMKQRKAF